MSALSITRLPLLAATAILLASCQAPHTFQEPRDSWLTYHGQLRHEDGGKPIIGSVVITFVPVHNFQLDYSAGPGFPLLNLREDKQWASARGTLIRGSWKGEPHTAPAKLKSWFLLHEVFNKLAARRWPSTVTSVDSLTPGLWKAEITGSNGRAQRVAIVFPASGERFEFVFPVAG